MLLFLIKLSQFQFLCFYFLKLLVYLLFELDRPKTLLVCERFLELEFILTSLVVHIVKLSLHLEDLSFLSLCFLHLSQVDDFVGRYVAFLEFMEEFIDLHEVGVVLLALHLRLECFHIIFKLLDLILDHTYLLVSLRL